MQEQINKIRTNTDGAIDYILRGRDEHPNRFDLMDPVEGVVFCAECRPPQPVSRSRRGAVRPKAHRAARLCLRPALQRHRRRRVCPTLRRWSDLWPALLRPAVVRPRVRPAVGAQPAVTIRQPQQQGGSVFGQPSQPFGGQAGPARLHRSRSSGARRGRRRTPLAPSPRSRRRRTRSPRVSPTRPPRARSVRGQILRPLGSRPSARHTAALSARSPLSRMLRPTASSSLPPSAAAAAAVAAAAAPRSRGTSTYSPTASHAAAVRRSTGGHVRPIEQDLKIAYQQLRRLDHFRMAPCHDCTKFEWVDFNI